MLMLPLEFLLFPVVSDSHYTPQEGTEEPECKKIEFTPKCLFLKKKKGKEKEKEERNKEGRKKEKKKERKREIGRKKSISRTFSCISHSPLLLLGIIMGSMLDGVLEGLPAKPLAIVRIFTSSTFTGERKSFFYSFYFIHRY